MNSFDFKKDLKREGREIFEKEWQYISKLTLNVKNFKPTEEGYLPHQDLCFEFHGQKRYVEHKLDYYPHTGNIIIELIASAPVESLPFSMERKSKTLIGGMLEHDQILNYLDNPPSSIKTGLGLDTSIIDNGHLFHTIFICPKNNNIVKQIILKSKEIRDYVSDNYYLYDIVITKSRKEKRKWATISTKMPLKSLRDAVNYELYFEGSFKDYK